MTIYNLVLPLMAMAATVAALFAVPASPASLVNPVAGTVRSSTSPSVPNTPPDTTGVLINPGFECGQGYHTQPGIAGVVPDGWTALVLGGTPHLTSTQLWGRGGSCDPDDMGWEKIEGHDSFMFMGGYASVGQDFPSPPFDALLYQTVSVTQGTIYDLSGWLVSLCGGSAMPSDCPDGAYISKQLGVDPTGGTDPFASTVIWIEDRRPHYETRWLNLVQVVTAQADRLTVFVRIASPFEHHGNHAFADAVKVVEAPKPSLKVSRIDGSTMNVAWNGALGPDIGAIEGGNYRAYYDLQVTTARPGALVAAGAEDIAWQPWKNGVPAGSEQVTQMCGSLTYRFRVRLRSEQPFGEDGAWPPYTFLSPWLETVPVTLSPSLNRAFQAYMPLLNK